MSNSNIFDESMLFNDNFELQEIATPISDNKSYIATNMVSGQIVGASTGAEYHRLYIRKLYEKFVYGCRMSNSVNSIIVRCSEGIVDRDVHIICYGKLNGGDTALCTGGKLTATGKFDGKNRFIAKSMEVNCSEIEIKMEMHDLLLLMIPVLMLVLVIIWNPIMALLSSLGRWMASLVVPFIGGMAGAISIIKRKSRFFIPFRYRLKIGAFAGIVLSVIVALITH